MKLTDYTMALHPGALRDFAVPDLLARLKTADSADRLLIGDALADRMTDAAEAIVAAVSDSNWKVRWGAAHALGKSRSSEGAPALRELLVDPQPRVARTAAWALGRMRDPAAVPFLAGALHSSNSRLSAAAAWALGHIGSSEALAVLAEALDTAAPKTLRSISVAFAEIGAEATGRLVELLKSGSMDERNRAARILARSGPTAAALLLPLLASPDVKHRRAAAHILGSLGDRAVPAPDAASTPLNMEIQTALLRALGDEDLRVRLNAARSVGAIGFAEARTALEPLLQGGPEEVRSAANALAMAGDPAAGPALRRALERTLALPENAGRAATPAAAALERALSRLGLEPAARPKAPAGIDRSGLPTRSDYLAVVTPGLEMVAWEEIAGRLPGASLKTFDDGRVVFHWKGSPQACAILRSVRQVFHGGAVPEEIPLARRLRRYRVRTLPASLEPTTAYDMARLCNLGERDVFVDLMCGSASIAIERALDGPARAILAGDIDSEAIDAARENIAAGSQPVILVKWDARQLPLADHSVNAVAANLPYGKRSGSHSENRTLYPAVVSEIARVLRGSGTAVLLTTEKKLLRECIEAHPALLIVSERPIDADGLKPALFIVQKD